MAACIRHFMTDKPLILESITMMDCNSDGEYSVLFDTCLKLKVICRYGA